uniref:Transcriptional regulator n=1 Tax=Chloropicon laureae TaxID=464258 RepID=A0A7S3E292_9CHLO|mmetsp:Transcript_13634/g.35167  ORF Transcript_13634/g.35167 Transcript_13634/m.35167 type:complete len:385 (+) Transcript_13634:263-1417(+)
MMVHGGGSGFAFRRAVRGASSSGRRLPSASAKGPGPRRAGSRARAPTPAPAPLPGAQRRDALSAFVCRAKDEEGDKGEGPADDLALEDWRSFRAQLIQSYSRAPSGAEEATTAVQQQEDEGEKGADKAGEKDKASAAAPQAQPLGLWAHEIGNRPEKGCLIIARPDAFMQSQRYFHEAVIFIIDYSPQKGAVGLILNRPTQFTLKGISFDITSPPDDEEEDEGQAGQAASTASGEDDPASASGEAAVAIPEFLRDNRVYFGGDVRSASSTLIGLHPFDETIIPGAQKVMDGVYCNGKWFELTEENCPAVALDAPKYKFFAQYAGWAPGQLERELETNSVWIAAACSPEIVLKQVIQLPKPLWREVMELLGGEYALMSKQQYGEL